MNAVPILYAPPLADDATLALAEGLLTAPERETLAGLRFPKRRRDWLLGRLAAKEALARATKGAWEAGAVTITRQDSGAPGFAGPDQRLDGWSVSLSHGHGRAVGLVAPGACGVDLELVRGVERGGWRFFLTPEEREVLAAEPLGPHGEIVYWALKEAAYKAIAGAVPSVLSLPVDQAEAGRARVLTPEGELAARWVVKDGFVLAVAGPVGAGWLEGLEMVAW